MPKYKVYGHRLEVNHYIINAPTQDEAIANIHKAMKGKTNQVYTIDFSRKYVRIKKVKELI
jgi:hypothetical protein|tara:strand:+ start:275 stop:457 length:183 start_codon:yes stop_codon:yes gene_type:complete